MLDDLTPLRHLRDLRDPGRDSALFPPATAYRVAASQNRDTPLPLDEPRAPNPPAGAVIDYELAGAPQGPVTLEIADAQGQVVRRFRSDERPARPPADQYFANEWLQTPAPLPARAGHNRLVWDLRGERPRAADYDFSIAAVPGVDTPTLPQGLFVLPGRYEVRLTAGGRTLTAPLTVALDPRVDAKPADLAAQRDFYAVLAGALAETTAAGEQVQKVADRLQSLDAELAARPAAAALREAAKSAAAQVAAFQRRRRGGSSDDNLGAIAGVFAGLATAVEGADRAPTQPQREAFEAYRKRLDAARAHWQALANGPLRDLDRQVRAAGLAPVVP